MKLTATIGQALAAFLALHCLGCAVNGTHQSLEKPTDAYCKDTQKPDGRLTCHSPHNIAQAERVVRIGGHLQNHTPITIPIESKLTLREVFLQSGGVSNATMPTLSFLSEQTIAATSNSSVEDGKKAELGNLTDDAFVKLTTSLTNPTEINTLIPVPPGRSRYQTPPSTDKDEFIKDAFRTVKAQVVLNDASSPAKIDFASINLSMPSATESLDGLIAVFEAYEENNIDFAKVAVKDMRELKSLLSERDASGKEATQDSNPQTKAELAPPVVQQVVAMDRVSYLVGLENSNDNIGTIYVTPQLILETAIGNSELRDGDFVFAVPTSQTTLASQTQLGFETPQVATIGLSTPYTNAQIFSQVKEILERAQSDATQPNGKPLTLDSIAVLRREGVLNGRDETYYLPVPSIHTSKDPAFAQMGRVRPRDVFLFTEASRSPIVLARIVQPMRERIENRAKDCVEKTQAESRLPADGRFTAKAIANFKHYTAPVSRTASSILNRN
jgi:hypothetical protein